MRIVWLLVSLNIAQSLFIDSSVQNFRLEYRRFRAQSLKSIDRSFFNVYDSLNSKVYKIVKPYERLQVKWLEMRDKVLATTLDLKTLLDFNSTCNNISALFTNLIIEHEESLLLIFPGGLASPTPSEKFALSVFDVMEKQMEDIWKIYVKNISCVGSHLKSYLPSFEPVIDNICYENNQTALMMSRMFWKATKISSTSIKQLSVFIKKIQNCLTDKTFRSCIFDTVS